MWFFTFNNNKPNKKQTMLANIAALSIVVLQLLGQLNITVANNVGLGNHLLQEGKVKLAADSRVVTTKKEIENMTISANACNVSFDKLGNIYLPYKNQGTTKDKGCTVDLLTDKVDEIVLQSGLFNRVGLGACLKEETINSNVLPFAYSLTNEEVKKFHNGPLFANGSCYSCAEGCVKKTGLEVRWALDEGQDRGGYAEYAVMNVNPIATKMIYFVGKKWDMRNKYVQWLSDLVINKTDPKFHIQFANREKDMFAQTFTSICLNNSKEDILSPSTWEIVGTSPEPKMNRLLVFHLFPQKASRQRMLVKNNRTQLPEYVVLEEHPEGPICDEIVIIFPASNYRLLATPVTPIPTDTPIFNVGLRDHILQGGKVVLANGSIVAKKEDVEQYMSISADACDVDFNEEGNIVIHYKNQGTAKDKGCTVDLLTDKKDEIVFWTGVQNQGGLDDCMRESDINSNVLPFAYSLTNEEVKKFHNGPLFANGPCRCNEGCVEKTGLEVRWAFDEDQGKENVGLYANPIGTKLIYYLRKEWNLNKTGVYFDVIINQTVPKFRIKQFRYITVNLQTVPHIEFSKKYNTQPSSCSNNLEQNILSPSTWEIVGTSPEPKMNRLLVFHLLPQKSSRKRVLLENTLSGSPEYVVVKEHPDGPKCDEMLIIFSRDNYRLLTTPTSITSTPKPTQEERKTTSTTTTTSTSTSNNVRTISLPETTPEIAETSETTPPLTIASSLKKRTTTITSASTTMTTTTKGSSGLLFFAVIIVVILTVIGIGIAAYFFVINESFDKEENDVEAVVGTKEDVTGEDQKKEDREEGENKDNVKEEDQMKEYGELEEKKEDLKGDNQGKDEGTKDDNKAKEEIQTTTAKTAAPTTESQTKEQASAEDKNEEEGEEKKVETQEDE
uniref:Uncharacterized protein n=1 Tax=Meloidogyne incognita TaxID=6306 RepID=A0A914LW22_MELIC